MEVHLTNWVVGHSHLAFVASYSFWAFALIYLMLPQLVRQPIYSKRLMEWHYWLTTIGLIIFMVSLWIAGLIQSSDWLSNTIPFIASVQAMNVFFGARLFGGLLMGVGILGFVYNIWRTARRSAEALAQAPALVASSGGGR